jgi:hypothetical protein
VFHFSCYTNGPESEIAEVFITGKADHWLRSTCINTDSLTWSKFAIMLNSKFTTETSLGLIDNFKHAEQTLSATAYIDSFEELMGKVRLRNPTLTKNYFVGCFISGLKEYIKVPLRSHNPSTLIQAYALARNYDTTMHKRTANESYKWNSKSASLAKNLSQGKANKANEKLKVASRWEKGKCFKCHESWVPGHNKVYKFRNQVHLMMTQVRRKIPKQQSMVK